MREKDNEGKGRIKRLEEEEKGDRERKVGDLEEREKEGKDWRRKRRKRKKGME